MRKEFQKGFYEKIFRVSKEIVARLQKRNEEMVKKITYGSFSEEFRGKIEFIYGENYPENIKGKDGEKIY
jgi:hypothetical protein